MPKNMKNSALLAAFENAILLLGKAIALLLFAWLLGPAAQGSYTLFLATFALVTTMCVLGLDTSNNFWQARARAPGRSQALLGNSLLLTLPFSALGVGGLIGLWHQTSILSELSPPLYGLLLLAIPLGTLALVSGALLYGHNCFGHRLAGTFVHMFVFVAGLVWEGLRGEISVESGMAAWTIGLALCAGYWTLISWRRADYRVFVHRITLNRQVGYAWRSYPYFMMSAANFRLDNFILANYWGLATLGVYSVAVAAVEIFLYLPRSLVNATLTHQASHRTPSAARVLRPLSSLLLAMLPIALSAPPIAILVIFDAEFHPAILASLLLIPGIYAMAIGAVGSFYLFSQNRSTDASIAAALATGTTLITCFILIPPFGLIGAALATSVSYMSFCLYVLKAISRYEKVPLLSSIRPDWSILKRLRDQVLRRHSI